MPEPLSNGPWCVVRKPLRLFTGTWSDFDATYCSVSNINFLDLYSSYRAWVIQHDRSTVAATTRFIDKQLVSLEYRPSRFPSLDLIPVISNAEARADGDRNTAVGAYIFDPVPIVVCIDGRL